MVTREEIQEALQRAAELKVVVMEMAESLNLVIAKAERMLSPLAPQRELSLICALTAERFGLSWADLRSHNRRAKVAKARRVAQALSRRLTDASYPEIGQYYHQHHSSVIYGVRKAERDKYLNAQIDALVLHVKQQSGCELHRIVTSNHESYPPNS